jgi:predicted DCC family thiol-disulfide oxidoreductase YuxK
MKHLILISCYVLLLIITINGFKTLKIIKRTRQLSLIINNNNRNVNSLAKMISSSSPSSSSSQEVTIAKSEDKIDLLFDSECPICMMEVEFLKKRDIENRIRFTDLQSPDYNPADHGNVSFEKGMRKIRAVLPGGSVVTGVEVFRQTYKAIGLGWIFDLTSLPLVGKAADAIYDFWAENRLRITGRGELADVLRDRADKLADMDTPDCDAEGCAIEYD